MILSGEWIGGAIALAVGVPVLLVILTEVLGALQRRSNPAAGPVRLLRNWIVPVGALFGLLAFALRSDAEHVWTRVVATILGFLVILLILSAFNVALFGSAKEGSWQKRIPTIFVEIVRLLLVVVGLALLFQWVWNADVGGLIAALGVTSIVIGLALQNAVGGVISGLLLLFEQPFKIGDWLDVGSCEGRVIEVNWRAVHIDTGSGIQIVPNSTLSGASFTNKSQPTDAYWVSADAKFSTDDPPQEVMALLVEVARGLPERVRGLEASATYRGAGAYSVSIPVIGPGVAGEALTTYLSWLWYAARRRGFALDGDATDPIAEPQRLDEAIVALAPSLHLRPEDAEELRHSSKLQRYGLGEVIIPSGIVPDELGFIVTGKVVLRVTVGDAVIDVSEASAGEIIGQTALTRERTQAAVVAVDVVTVLIVPLSTLDDLVRSRPRLAAEIGDSLELKRRASTQALAAAGIDLAQLSER